MITICEAQQMYKYKPINYKSIHKLAKLIVCMFNTILLLFATHYEIITLLIIMNFTYFFGVNSVAYLLEKILHIQHKHDKI